MTAPQVYKIYGKDWSLHDEHGYEADANHQTEVILLSDHKEVVKEIYGRLSEAVNQIAADNVLEGKIDELEALVKRQALVIAKLEEQRNANARIADIECSIESDDAEITAILQEAK